MDVVSLKQIEIGIWRELYGEADWRELNYHYLLALGVINQLPFQFFLSKKVVIPFYDSSRVSTDMDKIMHAFLNLFIPELNIELSLAPALLLFAPPRLNNSSDADVLRILEDLTELTKRMYPNHHVLIFYESGRLKKNIENFSKKTILCSYNTKIISNYSSFEEYLQSLNSHNRRAVKRYISTFEHSDLEFKKIDVDIYAERMNSIYSENCARFDELAEPGSFWKYIEEQGIEDVDWYGVFDQNTLVNFVGLWTEGETATFAMYAKNSEYEKRIRDTSAYFYLYVKLIELSIKHRVKYIYNGFGLKETKAQFGFQSIDYLISVLV